MAVGPTQLLIIAIVVLVLFGASRLPQLGKNLGSGIRNFKDGLTGEGDDDAPLPDAEPPRQMTGKKSKKRHRPRQDEA